jgi:uncharacterized protein
MVLKRYFLSWSTLFVILAVMLMATGNARADDAQLSGPPNMKLGTIAVTGTGSVYAVPDIAKFGAGVVTEANVSSDAMAKNSQLMDAVVKAVKSAGIPDKDIKTSRITMEPVYSQPKDPSEKQVILGYRASNSIIVIVRDLSKAGAVIDAATDAGANKLRGVTFELSDEKAADVNRQALIKAVNDGAEKAKTIATAAKVGNLTLKSVSESGGYHAEPAYWGGAAHRGEMKAAVATPVSEGEQRVQAIASMVYSFG